MSSTTFKPIDPKRDEFRRYLERTGVIESLTKAFVKIVKEQPENPLDYLVQNLGDTLQQTDLVNHLQNELDEARTEIKRLRDIIQSVHPDALEETATVSETNDGAVRSLDAIDNNQANEKTQSAQTKENEIATNANKLENMTSSVVADAKVEEEVSSTVEKDLNNSDPTDPSTTQQQQPQQQQQLQPQQQQPQ